MKQLDRVLAANLGQVVHTHTCAAVTRQLEPVKRGDAFYGQKGNCRSGVALTMRHRLQWLIRAGPKARVLCIILFWR